MIEINLLPSELRKKEPAFKAIDFSGLSLKGLPLFKIGAGIGIFLVALLIMVYAVGIFTSVTVNSLVRKYNRLLPKKKEADILKTEVATMNQKVGAIDELMVKRFSWARKLNSLSDSVTPGIWLSELSYSEKVTEVASAQAQKPLNFNKGKGASARPVVDKRSVKFLIISGYAAGPGENGTSLIGKFMKSLKDNSSFYSDFNNIELGSIKSDKVDNQEVMNFKITCTFKDL